jgi:uncharacterized membrane protein
MRNKPRYYCAIWRYGVELTLIAALISFTLGGVFVWHSTLEGAEFVGFGVCLLSAVIWYDHRCATAVGTVAASDLDDPVPCQNSMYM